jgi:hypothetical protein
MNNAFVMSGRETKGNLLAVVDCFPLRQCCASHTLPKCLTFQ